MELRTRIALPLLAALSGAVITAISLLRLTVPAIADWYGELAPGLLDRVVDGTPAAVIGALAGVAATLVSLVLFARARGERTPRGLGVASVLVTFAVLLLAPGGVIPVAGYLFALTAIGIIITGTVLLTIRHPLVGVVVIGVLATLGVLVVVALDGNPLLQRILASVLEELPQIGITAAHLAVATGVVLSAIGDGREGQRGAVARWVLAHRIAITVVAALCSVPYAFVRATWLTPWPLFGSTHERLAADPSVLITGLMLGFGMLMAGVLTIGLVRPWGTRFPRWFAGLGGRLVPVGLPVISAMTVSVLFVVGGAEFIVQRAEGVSTLEDSAAFIEFLVVFPFWLWGPALGLATWAYAMHRARAGGIAAEQPGAISPQDLAQLEARESRDA